MNADEMNQTCYYEESLEWRKIHGNRITFDTQGTTGLPMKWAVHLFGIDAFIVYLPHVVWWRRWLTTIFCGYVWERYKQD